MFPDKRTNRATKKMLTKHNLRLPVREMNIVPGLHSTLISVPKLADAGYTMVFNKNGAAIYDDYTTQIMASQHPILDADRCHSIGLWKLQLDAQQELPHEKQNPPEAINVIFNLPSTCQTFLWHHHAAAGFPAKATFIKAVRCGNYATWPNLTVNLIHKYMSDSDKTTKGHLKGLRQGIRSTRQRVFERLIEREVTRTKPDGENSPPHLPPPTKLDDMFVQVTDLTEELHTDQTGAFPHTSQCGNRYIMVAIHLDSNYIFTEPMKNRTEGKMIKTYQRMITRIKAAGLGIKKQVLDNECLAAMKECIRANNMEYELVPPGQHRRNQAERAIQTFKAHFISILAGVDDKFPLSLWCHLLEQTELTLNLLRQSRLAPNISAFTHVHGTHDYMRKPFALIGCTIQTHVKPDDRHTWDARS
jgi:hypothetical protein